MAPATMMRYTPATDPLNGTMDQWMYLADNGTLINRSIVTKLGVRLAKMNEQFVRQK